MRNIRLTSLQTYGSWHTRRLNFVWQSLRRPDHFCRWLKAQAGGISPLDQCIPWLSWPAIDYLRSILRPGMKVFEWGGGGSTLFFLQHSCSVTTIESDPDWKKAIERRVSSHGRGERQNLSIELVRLKKNDPSSFDRYIAPVASGRWDLVLVDGADIVPRMDCVRAALRHVASDGFLVLDDAYRVDYAQAVLILQGWRRLEFWGLGPGRHGVTKTDVYVRPC